MELIYGLTWAVLLNKVVLESLVSRIVGVGFT